MCPRYTNSILGGKRQGRILRTGRCRVTGTAVQRTEAPCARVIGTALAAAACRLTRLESEASCLGLFLWGDLASHGRRKVQCRKWWSCGRRPAGGLVAYGLRIWGWGNRQAESGSASTAWSATNGWSKHRRSSWELRDRRRALLGLVELGHMGLVRLGHGGD